MVTSQPMRTKPPRTTQAPCVPAFTTDNQGRRVNSCCNTLRNHPTDDNFFVGINNGGGEVDIICAVHHLVFNIDLCICDWNAISQSRIGSCEVEFEASVGSTKADLNNQYRQWDPVADAWWLRNCTEALPACAQDDALMYYNFTDCKCYFTAVYFNNPHIVYCNPAALDPCYHGVDTFWELGDSGPPGNQAIVIGNREGTYIDVWRGSTYTGDWPIPNTGDGNGNWNIDGENYIRDAFLPGNSGRDITISARICHSDGGSRRTVIMTDGCMWLDPADPDWPRVRVDDSFSIECNVQGAGNNNYRYSGRVHGVGFDCDRINSQCVTIVFTFCDGNFGVTVTDDNAGGVTCNVASPGNIGADLVSFNPRCPFSVGFDPFSDDKFSGTVSSFDVFKDCERSCTAWQP